MAHDSAHPDATPPALAAVEKPRRRKRHIGLTILGVLVVAVVLVVVFWDWNWFKPLVEAQASSALGRRVTIGRLHVALGRVTTVSADDVAIANPADFPQQSENDNDFAKIGRLAIEADVMAYIHTRQIVLPQIEVDQPNVVARQLASGAANWNFTFGSSKPANTDSTKPADATATGPKIGNLVIHDGHAHVAAAKLKADMELAIATHAGQTADDNRIEVDAKGTYAAQPISGKFLGGALLSLRDPSKPYPVDLHAANGATHIGLVGTIDDPLAFKGTRLKLELSGQDMAALFPLTGIPIPQTPPYSIAGDLSYRDKKIDFDDFHGRVGKSDLNGSIGVDPGGARPLVVADLNSREVDLNDLAGFIGSTPGTPTTPGQTTAQRAQTERAEASPKLLPDTPINMPKVKAADIRLKYRGTHIEGRSMPLDNVVVNLTITDGNIELQPLSFGVGRGSIVSDIGLYPKGNDVHAKAKIDFRQVDLSRLMEATHLFHGGGLIGGSANIDTTGNSLATLLGNGDGGVRLFMAGGDLSSLLVDLSGFQFGNAILSALGIPTRATVKCMIGDFVLNRGVIETKILAIDTSEANIHGTGDIDLRNESLNYKVQTHATHFTIGSLPAPIDIAGTFKHPSIRPDPVALGLRAGAAVGLGVLFPPLALLPTIQLGLGEKNDCAGSVQRGAPVRR